MLQIWISLLQVTKATVCTSTVQTVASSISMFSAGVIKPLLKDACMHVCGRAHVCILPDQLAMHGWTRRGLWPLRRHWAAPTRQGRGGAGWAGHPSAAKFVWYVASPTTQEMFGLAKKEKKKKDCFYLKLEEIVAGRSEAGCVTEKANGVDEEKRSLQEKSRETTEADLLWRLWVVNLVSLSVEQVHIILWITYQYYRAHKLGDNRLHRKPLIVEHCDWTSQCQLQTVPVKGGNRGQRIKYSNSTGCSRLV